jgi:hypothetical protein
VHTVTVSVLIALVAMQQSLQCEACSICTPLHALASTDMHTLCCNSAAVLGCSVLQKTAFREYVQLDSAAAGVEYENKLIKDKLANLSRYNECLVRHAYMQQDSMVAAANEAIRSNARVCELSSQLICLRQSKHEGQVALVSTNYLGSLYTLVIASSVALVRVSAKCVTITATHCAP